MSCDDDILFCWRCINGEFVWDTVVNVRLALFSEVVLIWVICNIYGGIVGVVVWIIGCFCLVMIVWILGCSFVVVVIVWILGFSFLVMVIVRILGFSFLVVVIVWIPGCLFLVVVMVIVWILGFSFFFCGDCLYLR